MRGCAVFIFALLVADAAAGDFFLCGGRRKEPNLIRHKEPQPMEEDSFFTTLGLAGPSPEQHQNAEAAKNAILKIATSAQLAGLSYQDLEDTTMSRVSSSMLAGWMQRREITYQQAVEHMAATIESVLTSPSHRAGFVAELQDLNQAVWLKLYEAHDIATLAEPLAGLFGAQDPSFFSMFNAKVNELAERVRQWAARRAAGRAGHGQEANGFTAAEVFRTGLQRALLLPRRRLKHIHKLIEASLAYDCSVVPPKEFETFISAYDEIIPPHKDANVLPELVALAKRDASVNKLLLEAMEQLNVALDAPTFEEKVAPLYMAVKLASRLAGQLVLSRKREKHRGAGTLDAFEAELQQTGLATGADDLMPVLAAVLRGAIGGLPGSDKPVPERSLSLFGELKMLELMQTSPWPSSVENSGMFAMSLSSVETAIGFLGKQALESRSQITQAAYNMKKMRARVGRGGRVGRG